MNMYVYVYNNFVNIKYIANSSRMEASCSEIKILVLKLIELNLLSNKTHKKLPDKFSFKTQKSTGFQLSLQQTHENLIILNTFF